MNNLDHDTKAMSIYLREIGQTPLLTPKQEVSLAAKIKKGDEHARHLMVNANLRLVVKIAHDYANYGLPLLDLISEGNIGLIKAVSRFDPKKGAKFSTYAAWWIKQGIKRALANQSKTIRLPAHMVDRIAKLRRTEKKLTEETGREPTTDELAAELGVSSAMVGHMQTVALKPASLDAPIGDDDGAEFGDLIADEKARTPYNLINEDQLRAELETLLDELDVREREILMSRFGLRGRAVETLEDVGEKFSITRERVRQIQNAAIVKLRAMMAANERIDMVYAHSEMGHA
ncbi:MAG TPA: sigma-70 family RNA polymerase sigma factor [Kiritimatiellia bacterium]|nr:sigma-70 family RNA polymerase sigma factor [Kiritimatiellia bacterium]HMO99038.1 sigma-70 family RNA polymerase sigma factor [Kiritimatiellia bacterium]HMP96114.1 sigma-70 family RNA polymerase sigma factor [Kiritimatiellia bacterium]